MNKPETNELSYLTVQFSCSVMSDSLQPHGLWHARLPCPSPTPRAYSNSCPLSWWCHPSISSSVFPFSFYLQSLPASGSFPMSQFFALGGQSIGSFSFSSVLPMSIQDWFALGWTGWIFLHSKGLSRVSSKTTSKVSILRHSAFFIVQLSHPYMTTGKTIVLTRWQSFDFDVGEVMSLLFNMLSWLVILAWRIPGMGEPGGLLPVGSHRIGHDWSDLAAAADWETMETVTDFIFLGSKITADRDCSHEIKIIHFSLEEKLWQTKTTY